MTHYTLKLSGRELEEASGLDGLADLVSRALREGREIDAVRRSAANELLSHEEFEALLAELDRSIER